MIIFINKILPRLFVTLLFLFLFLTVSGEEENTQEYCDSLIKTAAHEFHNKNYPKALELLSDARILAENKNWNRQQFLAINITGVIHSELLNYGEALDYFLEAYKIALKGADVRNEMTARINIAIMYSKEGYLDKAIDYLKKIYEDSKVNKDTINLGFSAANLASLYNKSGKLDEAEYFLELSFKYLKEDERGVNHANVVRIENVFLNKNYKRAKEMAYNLVPKLQGVRNKEYRISLYLILSKIYDDEKDLDNAINSIDSLLKDDPNISTKIEVYEHLSGIYFKKREFDRALSYKDSIILAKDSLHKVTNLVLAENNRIKFEIMNYQKDLEYNKALRTKERLFFFLLLILAIISIWAIYNSFTKEKQKKAIAEWNQKVIALELEQEKSSKLLLEKQLKENETIALLEQNRFDNEQDALKNEIKSKNRELVAKTMYFSSKNELINEISNSLNELPDVTKKRDLLRHVQVLKNELKNESESGNYLMYFEETNQEFVNSLKEKHPNLTPNDIRFLSYIYIGLNTKEISSLLNITTDSCKKKKMRVSQKLNLERGAYSLYSYLTSI